MGVIKTSIYIGDMGQCKSRSTQVVPVSKDDLDRMQEFMMEKCKKQTSDIKRLVKEIHNIYSILDGQTKKNS